MTPYERITNRIVTALERGVRPWVQPWTANHAAGPVSRPLRHNGVPYAGVNVLALWCAALERRYASPIWMTFRQALELGAHVRKGETGSLVVYAGSMTVEDENAETESEQRRVRYLKGYSVFNIEQIEGLPAKYTAQAVPAPNPEARIAEAERFAARTGAVIRHGGDSAFYAPHADTVHMPPFEAFRDAFGYYATFLHELTHWTGHGTRLARNLRNRFGDEAYAAEELIAEVGSAFLCADLGITLEPRDDHASYLAFWLKLLRSDSRAIFTAAAHAQRAADFLHAQSAAQEAA
jgi:antirestriction protein ArdC